VQIRFSSKDTNNDNYLILDRQKLPIEFIFNLYKTDKSYGKQTIAIPEERAPYLHQYIIQKDFKSKEYLFNIDKDKKEMMGESQFSKLFSTVFTKVYERNINNQLFRIAYATYWNKRSKNVAEKKKYANDLSHDLTTHLQYEKYNVA
jgi:hypothetical protein